MGRFKRTLRLNTGSKEIIRRVSNSMDGQGEEQQSAVRGALRRVWVLAPETAHWGL